MEGGGRGGTQSACGAGVGGRAGRGRGGAPLPLQHTHQRAHHLASGLIIWGWSQMKVGLMHCAHEGVGWRVVGVGNAARRSRSQGSAPQLSTRPPTHPTARPPIHPPARPPTHPPTHPPTQPTNQSPTQPPARPPTWLSRNSPTRVSSRRAVVSGGLHSTSCFLHCGCVCVGGVGGRGGVGEGAGRGGVRGECRARAYSPTAHPSTHPLSTHPPSHPPTSSMSARRASSLSMSLGRVHPSASSSPEHMEMRRKGGVKSMVMACREGGGAGVVDGGGQSAWRHGGKGGVAGWVGGCGGAGAHPQEGRARGDAGRPVAPHPHAPHTAPCPPPPATRPHPALRPIWVVLYLIGSLDR